MQEQSTVSKKHQQFVQSVQRERRRGIFQERRPNPQGIGQQQQPSYLESFDQGTRFAIIQSLTGVIPIPLPPVSTVSISYYRRSNQHVFMTEENGRSNHHLVYESLWMLTLARPEDYPNFGDIERYFNQHFPFYLNCGNAQITEMAIIVAGNHVFGGKEQVLSFANNDNFWVFANHVIEGKLELGFLFKQIENGNEKAYKLLYQLSNSKGEHKDLIIKTLLQEERQAVLETLIAGLDNISPHLENSLRIIGNLLMDSNAVDKLLLHGVLVQLQKLLSIKKRQVREEVCWALSNIAAGTEFQSTTLLNTTKLIARLLALLETDVLQVKVEIMHILLGLVNNAAPKEVFSFLLGERVFLQNVSRLAAQQHAQLQPVVVALLEGIKKLTRQEMDEQEGRAYMKSLDRYGFGKFVDLDLDVTEIEIEPPAN